jgi:hypothetical protein
MPPKGMGTVTSGGEIVVRPADARSRGVSGILRRAALPVLMAVGTVLFFGARSRESIIELSAVVAAVILLRERFVARAHVTVTSGSVTMLGQQLWPKTCPRSSIARVVSADIVLRFHRFGWNSINDPWPCLLFVDSTGTVIGKVDVWGYSDPDLDRLKAALGVPWDSLGEISRQDLNAKYAKAFSPLVAWLL